MNGCKITPLPNGIFKIETDQCIFRIKCEDGGFKLDGITLTSESPRMIKVPKTLPSGDTIDRISSRMMFDGYAYRHKFEELILDIDDDINQIEYKAFVYVNYSALKYRACE